MSRPSLARTTRTVELAQLRELQQRLVEQPSSVTAAEIGLAGATPAGTGTNWADPAAALPDDAVLHRLSWSGSPQFPYVYGHFSRSDQRLDAVAELHTPALRALCHRLKVRQVWGIGSACG